MPLPDDRTLTHGAARQCLVSPPPYLFNICLETQTSSPQSPRIACDRDDAVGAAPILFLTPRRLTPVHHRPRRQHGPRRNSGLATAMSPSRTTRAATFPRRPLRHRLPRRQETDTQRLPLRHQRPSRRPPPYPPMETVLSSPHRPRLLRRRLCSHPRDRRGLPRLLEQAPGHRKRELEPALSVDVWPDGHPDLGRRVLEPGRIPEQDGDPLDPHGTRSLPAQARPAARLPLRLPAVVHRQGFPQQGLCRFHCYDRLGSHQDYDHRLHRPHQPVAHACRRRVFSHDTARPASSATPLASSRPALWLGTT